jgi:hypothetical protein
MNRALSLRCSIGWRWLKRYPFTAVGIGALLVVAVIFCRRQDSEWEQVYLTAAGRLWRGEDLYPLGGSYLYPPFMAWAALPFLFLRPPLARLVWFAVNAVCLLALLRWSWRLAGGGRLEGCRRAPTSEGLAALLGCLCGISYVQNCLAHQQTDIVITALLIGGCVLLRRGWPLLAAASLGLAAACKCTGLLFAPYLLWRGRPLASLWLLTVALGVNLLPNLTAAPPANGSWAEEYAQRFLKPQTEAGHYVGTWGSDPVYNQSITGLAQRWCVSEWTWTATDCTIRPRSPLLTPQALRLWVYGVEVTLLAIVLVVCGKPFRQLPNAQDGQLQALECGTVLLLMLLLSPMSSKAHFGTLILPGFCLARAALASPGWVLKGMLSGAVLLGLLSNKDPLGERLYTLSLWYGVATWQTLLLLAGCLLAYRRGQERDSCGLPCPADTGAAVHHAA